MKLLLLFITSLLNCAVCFDNLYDIGNSLTEPFHNAVLNILRSCTENQSRNVLLLDVPDNLHTAISTAPDHFVITTRHSNFSKNQHDFHTEASFIVMAVDYNDTMIYDFPRWKSATSKFLILVQQYDEVYYDDDDVCESADFILRPFSGWSRYVDRNDDVSLRRSRSQILNAVFLCWSRYRILFLYGYNFYNNHIPREWKRAIIRDEIINEINGEPPWYLYRRLYNTLATCNVVYFEKTTTLDYYPTRANVKQFPPMMGISTNLSRLTVHPSMWDNNFTYFDGKIMGTIFKFLNATVFLKLHGKNYELYDDSQREEMLEDIGKGDRDICLNSYDNDVIRSRPSVIPMTPIIPLDIGVINSHRGTVDVNLQIMELLNIQIVASMIIISIVLIFILGYMTNGGFVQAALNTFRFVLGLSFGNLPTHVRARMLFVSLFPFMIIADIFQSNIVGILTSPRVARNVESLEELKAFGYKIYAGYGNSEYFELFEREICGLRKSANEHCTEYVLNDSQAACIDDADYLKSEVVKYSQKKKLHLMKEPIGNIFTSYAVRREWPIEPRFTTLLTRLKESGLVNHWLKQSYENYSATITKIHVDMEEPKEQRLTIGESINLFIVFVVGLIISTIVFLIELMTLIPLRKIRSISFRKQYLFLRHR